MPTSPPPRLDLFFTRGSTYHEAFGFADRAATIDDVVVQFVVKRRDAQLSSELLRLTGTLTVDPDDEDDIIATFTATPAQTLALPTGESWWVVETQEAAGTVILRQLEGRFLANE